VPPALPLFTTMLNYRHSHAASAQEPVDSQHAWDGIRHVGGEERTNYPLGVSVNDRGVGFAISTQCVKAIDPSRINAYLNRAMESLIAALRDAPEKEVRSLDILPETERHQLLVYFNDTARAYGGTTLIHQMVEARAAAYPDAPALLHEGEMLSYGELNRRANQLAHYLIGLGARPDDRVAICMWRGIGMVIGWLGILKAGCAYVPLDPAYPTERLAYMIEDSSPVAVLTEDSLQNVMPVISPQQVVVIDDRYGDGKTIARQPDGNPERTAAGLTENHLVYVMYTSGSTGQAKAVMIEHRNLCNCINALHERYRFRPGERNLQLASMSFDVATLETWGCLTSGATLVLRTDAWLNGATAFWAHCAEQGVNWINFSTMFWEQMTQDLTLPIPECVRQIVIGGEAVSRHAIENWFARTGHRPRLCNHYGPTETTIEATAYEPDPTTMRWKSIGRPIANLQVYILDPMGQSVPIGVTGEIHIAGTGVARGYLNRPDLTAERFIPDPFSAVEGARMYRTGDLGRYLADGNIEYLGRNDFQVKIRGFRIEPSEVEARLSACEGVLEAAVIAREDRPRDLRLVGYVVAKHGTALSVAHLRAQLAETLPDFMLPSAIVQMDRLPMTPNRKLDRKALPAPQLSALATQAYEAPQGVTEIALAAIWQDLLGIERIGRHDHFFELGGHSLMIIAVIAQLRKRGIQMNVRAIFEAPTVLALASSLATHAEQSFVVPPNAIPDDCAAITPAMLPLVTLSEAEIEAIVAASPGGACNIQDIYPLGPLQEGILFHHLLQDQGDAYITRHVIECDSRDRMDDFLTALQGVIDRHDILRTSIHWQELTRPVQVVHRSCTLPVHEIAPVTQPDGREYLLDYTDPRHVRMDLAQGPLLAAYVMPSTDGQCLLSLLTHHLACDHVGVELIVAEVELLLQGRQDALTEPVPYRNFIAQTLSVPSEVHEAYFRRELGNVETPTAPYGILDVHGDGSAVNEEQLLITDDLALAIRETARREGVTPATLFHLAWAQVLAQCCGLDNV
ncbi:non-ribosomal peptide synthetase, partial [Massilia phyllosphaerae]|uniref:non-ribosomal peptide synthetase n=1 Tax=Massilia phyllosphaerae TaxID=3106034 RepID=UPI002B1CAD24